MNSGWIDAQLGGGLVKKRIALGSAGQRGRARVIVATNVGGRWFFLYLPDYREAVSIALTCRAFAPPASPAHKHRPQIATGVLADRFNALA